MNQKPTTSRPVLGKGLASLLPVSPPAPNPAMTAAPAAAATMGTGAMAAGPAIPVADASIGNANRIPGLTFTNIEDIATNPYQPRREFSDAELHELSLSILANGIIQPLVVRKGATGYQLIAGERRLRAAKLAGLKQVPIVIRKSTDREALEIALVENVQRENLNCIDEALAYLQLMQDFNLTQDETAERVGKDRSTVANFVRLLRLPEAIIDDLKKGTLSFGHGKVLLSLEDQDQRLLARKAIIEGKLSVRASEALVQDLLRGKSSTGNTSPAKELTPVQSRLKNLALDLTRSVGVRTEVKGNEKRGKMVLHYSSREELERLIALMQNSR
ncbi:MAG: ParB/RepB/Spo0J family partition protein [Bdellovibrionales bacterium]|nr:ParB/RepB/Spo0J family partition protein [Bdellovibrionales bacterium]